MKQKNTKQVTYWLSVIIVGIALGLALQFVRAWTEPTDAPPGGNVGAPINTSLIDQVKSGGLGIIGGFVTDTNTFLARLGGNVGIGTVNPRVKLDVAGGIRAGNNNQVTICNATTEGTIRYNTAKKIEFCDGGAWKTVGGGSEATIDMGLCKETAISNPQPPNFHANDCVQYYSSSGEVPTLPAYCHNYTCACYQGSRVLTGYVGGPGDWSPYTLLWACRVPI